MIRAVGRLLSGLAETTPGRVLLVLAGVGVLHVLDGLLAAVT